MIPNNLSAGLSIFLAYALMVSFQMGALLCGKLLWMVFARWCDFIESDSYLEKEFNEQGGKKG
jgi:hypothetical protein